MINSLLFFLSGLTKKALGEDKNDVQEIVIFISVI